MKNKFISFLNKSNKKGSQKASSYIRALDLLDKIIYSKAKNKLTGSKSIYDINSTKTIEELYSFILKEQKDKNGIFENEEPKSYWKNGFYSAAIKSYLDFLNQSKISNKTTKNRDRVNYPSSEPEKLKKFDFKKFQDNSISAGLIFKKKLIIRFVASLLTKPFIILTGLSGSGKTKLAQSFAQWICEDSSQYCIVPVGADWTNKEPLLGYPNALDENDYVNPENGVLTLIKSALKNEHLPYFLILDEMNLSHVERYFAEFLSAMESGEEISLHNGNEEKNGVPSKIRLPNNLFLIGTVNIDETTYMFSPKVLDRANTIEFRISETELKEFFTDFTPLNSEILKGQGSNMAQSFLNFSHNKKAGFDENLKATLLKFFNELKKTGAEFGYRTASEISTLYNLLETIDDRITENEKLDIAIMQKLLPKLHGSRRKLMPVLNTLASFCVEEEIKVESEIFENSDFDFNSKKVKYPLSLEKIKRMYKGAIDHGFASYAEA